MAILNFAQPASTEWDQTKFSLLRWWIVALVILIPTGIIRFTGYNFQLPYRATDVTDERNLFASALAWRGVSFQPGALTEIGYPPGIVAVDTVSLVLNEQWLHRSTLDVTAEALATSRGIGTAFGLLTGVFLGLLARRLGNNTTGWLTMLGWLLLGSPLAQASEARAEPGLMLFMALTLYLTVIALESTSPGWAVLAIIVALLDLLFKYSAYPLLMVAAVPTIIYVFKRRRKWQLVVLIEVIALGATAFIVLFADPIQAALVHNSGKTGLFDIAAGLYFTATGINQTGIIPPVMLALSAIGTLLFWRRTRQKPIRRISWFLIIGTAYFMAWSAAIYYFEWFSEYSVFVARYTVSASVAFVPIVVISAELVGEWLGERFNQKLVMPIFLAAFSLVWLVPQLQMSLGVIHDRTVPSTRAAIMQWSLSNLGTGTVIVIPAAHWIFSKEWGGWDGPYRVFLDEPITTHSLTFYRQEDVNYAVIADDTLQQYQKSKDVTNQYLANMLLMKHFPRQNQTNPEWEGPVMGMYRLWRMQYATNIRFDNGIRLAGYDLSSTHPLPGDVLKFRFYWQADTPPTDNYNLFVHLYPQGPLKLLAQSDGPPANPERPTITWNDPGETLISSEYTLQLPTTLTPGCYQVAIGLYNYRTGQRLSVGTQDYTVLRTYCVGLQQF